jgi:hypothetical protein
MNNTTSRVLIGIDDIQKANILSESEKRKLTMLIREMAKKRQRPERQPAPDGSISIREAERKYGISARTISGWVSKGYIPILLRTKNWLYISEAELVKFINLYKTDQGQGKQTIKKISTLIK